MSTRCTTAVIAVAGYGTRRLPITKAIEKCMIPVGDRPIVDYIVEDCLAAGITNIIFVVGEQSDQVRTYYGSNHQLEEYLTLKNKPEALALVHEQSNKAMFSFVVQDRQQPYGTSIPLWLAKEHLPEGESFLYLYGDNLLYKPGHTAIAEFIAAATKSGASDAMVGIPVPHDQVYKYGIIETKQQNGVALFDCIVEKPKVEEAHGNLNNPGCFLFRPDIFTHIERSTKESTGDECFITDALNWYHQAGNDIMVYTSDAEYLDCGSTIGWLYANNRIVGPAT